MTPQPHTSPSHTSKPYPVIEITRDRQMAQRRIRATTAYSGARGLVDTVLVLSLVGGLALLGLGLLSISEGPDSSASVMTIATGVMFVLGGLLQRCLVHAVLDIADAAISTPVPES